MLDVDFGSRDLEALYNVVLKLQVLQHITSSMNIRGTGA